MPAAQSGLHWTAVGLYLPDMRFVDKPPRPAGSAAPPRATAVWLPWLAAPAFFLLPIGGCGGMAALRRQAVASVATLPGPAAPATSVVAVVPSAR